MHIYHRLKTFRVFVLQISQYSSLYKHIIKIECPENRTLYMENKLGKINYIKTIIFTFLSNNDVC